MKKALTIGVIILFFAMTVTPIVNSSCITTATHGPSKTIDNKDTQTLSNENISVDISLTATKIRWRTWKFETTLQNTGKTTISLGSRNENGLLAILSIDPLNWPIERFNPYSRITFLMPDDCPIEITPNEKIDLPTRIWKGWIKVRGPYSPPLWLLPSPAGEYQAVAVIMKFNSSEKISEDSVTISLSGIFGK